MPIYETRVVTIGEWLMTVGIAFLAGWLAGSWYEESKHDDKR